MLTSITAAVPAALATTLANFESAFTYPLGPGRTFRISHGTDYGRFYRSQGEAQVLALHHDDRVTGVMAAARRELRLPDRMRTPSIYLGDLKIAQADRGGLALLRLARGIQAWAGQATAIGWSVVMDGTAVGPRSYSGRLDIPALVPVARIVILRLPCQPGPAADDWHAEADQAAACFAHLSCGSTHACHADRTARSRLPPVWLRHPLGQACGVLEDTLLAKRLWDDHGDELVSAHFGRFAWSNPAAGARCLTQARLRAAAYGYPALFCAVPESRLSELRPGMGSDVTVTGATIHACGLPEGGPWIIDTAEI